MTAREQKLRSNVFYGVTGAAALLLGVYLLWALRALIVPAAVGGLSAYICLPLLAWMHRRGVPRWAGVAILLGGMAALAYLIVTQLRAAIPEERESLQLRTRALYKLNTHYAKIKLYFPDSVRLEIAPLLKELNEFLALDDRERALFELDLAGDEERAALPERYQAYHRYNVFLMKHYWDPASLGLPHAPTRPLKGAAPGPPAADPAARAHPEPGPGSSETPAQRHSAISSIAETFTVWLTLPFVFLFLLFDNNTILRYFVSIVPNRYFEVSLTVLHNVDRALGAYLRGITLECGLMGLTFFLCLCLIGVPAQAALGISLIAAITNAIPFLGPAIGFIVGAGYALIAEQVRPLLPFLSGENLLLGMVLTVVVAKGLDDAVFQPIVLGHAVDLHPLLVVFGVMGGHMLFGLVGMLFAIPVIVIVKVVLETLLRELKAYHLI